MRGPAYAALNHRQQLFVDGVLEGKTLLAAALEAGYAQKSAQTQGSTLIRNPKVRRALAEVRAPGIASGEEIQRFLTASMRGKSHTLAGDDPPPFAEPGRVVVCEVCTNPIPLEAELKERIKAAEVLAKTRGMMTVQVTGSVTHEVYEGPDISRWPLELAEQYRDLCSDFAEREAILLEAAAKAQAADPDVA